MADSPNLRALARQLADMRRRQDRQEQASNSEQLKYSSLDDGSVVEKDASGSIVSRWGKQHDGTHGTAILNGPTPPVPTAPTVDGTAGSLTVTWDGSFPGDRRVPLDFQTVQIGVGAPDGDLSMVGVITSEAGGSKSLSVDPGDYDVALRSRAASGRMSAWSTPTRATVEPVVDPEVIARLEGAFTTSTEAPTPADGQDKPEGAYWTQIDDDGAQVARWRWVDEEWIEAPIAVEFIPEAYIDFLAANEAFIDELGASVALIETLLAHELGVSGRLALEDGAQLHATQPNYDLTLGATGLTMTARVDVGLEHRWTGPGGRTLHGGLTSGGLLQLVSGGPGGAGQGGPGAWGPLRLDDSTTDAHPTHLVTLPGEAQQQVMSLHVTSGDRSVGSGFPFDHRLWRISLSGHPDPQRQAPWDTTGPGGHAIEDAGTGIEVWSLPDERKGTAALARTIPYGQTRTTPTWLALDGTTAIEGHGATVRTWDVTTGQQVSAHTVSEPITQVSRVDGVAMVSYGHHVTGIDIETRSEVFSWDLGDILQSGDTLRQFAMVDGTYYASLETGTGGAFIELNTGSGASVVRATMSTATGNVAFNSATMRGTTRTERLIAPRVNTFATVGAMQAELGGAVDGAAASTLDPPIDWRLEAGQWVPAPGQWLLDEAILEGDVDTGTALTIPDELQGMFTEYRIQIQAGVVQAPADNVRPLLVLVNSDSSSAYRVQADAVHHNLGTVMFQNLAATAWPRTGFVGTNRGNLSIEFSVDSFGDVGYMPWQTTGWANGANVSGGGFKIFGGGRWIGPEQPLTHFLIRTTQGSETWRTSGEEGYSTARLWGTR